MDSPTHHGTAARSPRCSGAHAAYLQPNTRILDPKNDVTFKMLFSAEQNRHLLTWLLSAVLEPDSPIDETVVLNPEIDPAHWGSKGGVLDLLVRLCDGTQIDVEMQLHPHRALEERFVYYWANLYCGQLNAGEPYRKLRPVVGIYFLAFERFSTKRWHTRFQIRECEEGFAFCDALELHVAELPKLPTAPVKELEAGGGNQAGRMVHWCQFLAAESEEALEALAMIDPEIHEAKDALDALSADPKARRLAEDRALWQYVLRQEVEHQRSEGMREGEEKGRREGEEKGRREGMLEAIGTTAELLELELSPQQSEAMATMSVSQLRSLLEALQRMRRWPE